MLASFHPESKPVTSANTEDKTHLSDIPSDSHSKTTSASSSVSGRSQSTMVSQGRASTRSVQSSQKRVIPLQRTQQRKLIWTDELQQLFLHAITLCDKKVSPKRVLHHMNVEGLTRANVASHLQKHRKRAERENVSGGAGSSQDFLDDSSDEEKSNATASVSGASSQSSGVNHNHKNPATKSKTKSKKFTSSKHNKPAKSKQYKIKPTPATVEPSSGNSTPQAPTSSPPSHVSPSGPTSMLSPSLQPLSHPIHSQVQSSFQQFNPAARVPSPSPSTFALPFQSPSPTPQFLPSIEQLQLLRKEDSFRTVSPISTLQSNVISPQPIRAAPNYLVQNRNPSPTPHNAPPSFQPVMANYPAFPYPNAPPSTATLPLNSSPLTRAVSPSIAKILNHPGETYGQYDEIRYRDTLSTTNTWSM